MSRPGFKSKPQRLKPRSLLRVIGTSRTRALPGGFSGEVCRFGKDLEEQGWAVGHAVGSATAEGRKGKTKPDMIADLWKHRGLFGSGVMIVLSVFPIVDGVRMIIRHSGGWSWCGVWGLLLVINSIVFTRQLLRVTLRPDSETHNSGKIING
jgi:hypothetical protein